MIRTIEELSLNAWPSLQTVHYDGWVLRLSAGYTNRANSINPLYPSSLGMDEKLHFCEDFYRSRNLPVVFKLTQDSQPDGLDTYLAEAGYQKDGLTSLQTFALAKFAQTEPAPGLFIWEDLREEWLDAFCRISPKVGAHRPTLKQMLLNIQPAHCFAGIQTDDGQIIACGLGVLQSGRLGLYDIATDSDHRQRGYARRVVTGLMAWAKNKGALSAYLQVMLNNAPALNLYSKVGFSEEYRYWYRVKP